MATDNTNILSVKQQFSIVGNSTALNIAIERALKVAPFDLSVLIIGESGSGKEFFPQIIHRYSRRKNKRYTVVNCGAIPEGTIESELFGHVKGAFTGADKDRRGYFEETNGGTIFLDEVAEMPLATQARLLRVLQNGEYIKVGSDVVQKTDVRVVAATNKDLLKAVKEGKFREDLYYRLSTIQIDIPALRDRTDDIRMIVRVFAHDFAEKNKTVPVKFSEDALNALTMYSWPGNVRQLKSLIERICVYEAGKEISADIIKTYIPTDTVLTTSVATVNSSNDTMNTMLLNMISKLFNELENMKEKIKTLETKAAPVANIDPTPVASSRELNHSITMPTLSKSVELDSFQPTALEHNPAPIALNPSIMNAPKKTYTSKHKSEYIEDIPKDNLEELSDTNYEYKSLEEIEKEAIEQALTRNKGRRKITAEQLKISERTLYRKIEEYNLGDKYK
ncbi:MAG: sigma-54 interaction domain-containing protein [Muribaculaceae bacterium]